MRMSRRAGLLSRLVGLVDLWAAAQTVTTAKYAPSSSGFPHTGAATATVSGGTASPVWVICDTGHGICFAKVKNDVVEYLKTATRSSGSPTTLTVETSGSDTMITSGTAYGVVMVVLRFPGIAESVVDNAFADMTATILASRETSSPSSVYVEASAVDQTSLYTQSFVTVAAGGTGYFSVVLDGQMLFSTGSIAFWRSYNSRYYLSNDGESNASVYMGTICQMEEQ